MANLASLTVKLTGDTGQLIQSLTVAEKRVATFGTRIQGLSKLQATGLSQLGRGFLTAAGQSGILTSELSVLTSSVGGVGLAAAGAAIGVGALVGGLGFSIKAAIDFEAQLTRVAKTADLTDDEMERFGDAITDISRDLPVTTGELSRIGVVAGQLGITGVENISKFVEELAKLSTTTQIDPETLATGIGQIIQVLGVSVDEVDNFGSAITDLGNKFPSTEAEMIDFIQRIAGIGKVLNLSAAELAGIASAFGSAGVDAERGGTAVQRVLIAMQEAAAKGGEELQLFALLTGQTADSFRDLLENDPAEAFVQVIEGLRRSGKEATRVLDELGLSDARLTSAFLAVANSAVPARDQIDAATAAFAANTATNIEVERQLKSTAAQWQLLQNNVSAVARSVGEYFNPAIRAALVSLNALIDFGRDAAAFITDLDNNFRLAGVGIGIAMTVLLGPIGLVATGIAALGVDWREAWNDMKAVAEDTINAIIAAIEGMVRGFGAAIDAIRIPGTRSALDKIGLTADLQNAAKNFSIGRVGFTGGGVGTGTLARDAAQLAAAEDANAWALLVGATGDAAADANFDIDALRTYLDQLAQQANKTGAGMSYLERVMHAAADGTIELGEALSLGLSDAQVVALELAVAQNRIAEQEFRRRIELTALAQAFPGLNAEQVRFRLGLAAISEHLRNTGESIEQFIHDTATSALDGFRSAFDAIFNRPTKETLQLDIKKTELELQRSLLLRTKEADDPRVKALDEQIAAIEREIDIRAKEFSLMKLRTEILDATVQTDEDVMAQAALLRTAIQQTSAEVERLQPAVFFQTLAAINAGNALNAVADAARDTAVALGGAPSFASGVRGFGGGLARVHKDELLNLPRGTDVFTAAEASALVSGRSGGSAVAYVTMNVFGDVPEATQAKMRRDLARTLREELGMATLAGPRLSPSAFTPRR